MYVRLAFAVAAHLESEILIVDEVLAVGDAEFQKKCLGKMGDVSKKEGRTVLFVSHNMSAIKTLCTKGLFLKNGMAQKKGDISDVINYYLSSYKDDSLSSKFEKSKIEGKDIELKSAEILDGLESNRSIYEITEKIKVRLVVGCKNMISNTYLYIAVQNDQEETFIESDSFDYPPNVIEEMKIGDNELEFEIGNNILPVGFYTIYLSFASSYSNNFLVDTPGNILKFEVVDSITQRGIRRKANTSFLTKIIIK
jgi:lipopolysaccharide transport system ATP-binding protein